MKFHIFKKFEWYAKPVIYFLIIVLSGCLILSYLKNDNITEYFSFVVSILYALVLFLITLPISKIDRYVSDKLYEREGYYLTLRRMRDVTNDTIHKIDYTNPDDAKEKIIEFQLRTGRDDESRNARLNGHKTKPYIKENGFEYTSKMYEYEQNYIKSIDENNDKLQKKSAKKLEKYYRKICKKLDKNYERIMKVYSGQLQQLLERDEEISNSDYNIDDLKDKVDEIAKDLETLKEGLKALNEEECSAHMELQKNLGGIAEQISDIGEAIVDIAANLTKDM